MSAPSSFTLFWMIAAAAAAFGCGKPVDDNVCSLPIGGRYQVLEHTQDPGGCGDGTAQTDLEHFELRACDDGGFEFVTREGTTGCTSLAQQLVQKEGASGCSGGSRRSYQIRSEGEVQQCVVFYDRIDATEVAAREVVIEQRSFSASQPPGADGGCTGGGEGWTEGRNLPECSRRRVVRGLRLHE